jgi:hypothetical protein
MGRREDGGRSNPAKSQIRPPGAVTLDEAEVTDRFRAAFRRSLAPGEDKPSESIVWVNADAELVLRPAQARVACDDGLVRVAMPVYTEQTDEAEIFVPFAVGRPDAPAGLIMATETRPRGPDLVVDRWAEPLLAAAWEALVGVAVDATAPALPAALSAVQGRLEIAAQPPVEAK